MDLNTFVKGNPRGGRATDKMVELAGKIARILDLEEPDYSSFAETRDFISDRMDDYMDECKERRRVGRG